MSAQLPAEILSDHIRARMRERRLVAAVFFTFQFDAGFFEQEILPVLLDIPLSHAKAIRLVQLDDALRHVPRQIAVYYDAHGIVTSDAGSPKLDVRRIPIRHGTGVFHPKNIFFLVEDADGVRALLAASSSANITRSGWWENIEACHFEEIPENGRTRVRDDLLAFLNSVRAKVRAETDQTALDEVRDFVKKTEQRQQRSSEDVLHTHFYGGREPVADFLDGVAGQRLRGAYLEVISPFFDDAMTCGPLRELVERFEPKETRVYLPREPSGEARCRKEIYDDVRKLPATSWGKLDASRELTHLGRSSEAAARFVHAKVYRFFTQNPKREIYFVGSANLTNAAHSNGGNVESGFLVEVIPARRPEFWLATDEKKPISFSAKTESEAAATTGGTRLSLRYAWDTATAHGFWDASTPSPELRLEARGIPIGIIAPLPPREWTPLDGALASSLRELLAEAAVLYVHGDGAEPGLLLVQEEGMSHKPSLLFHLSAADILRYWALLTPAQKSAFLEARAPDLALVDAGADLVARAKTLLTQDTLFDRFAGFFHAFACLERSVRQALEKDNSREATYRLFGKKYDSLGSLLDRVLAGDGAGDLVDRYVIAMCGRQLCREVARDFPDFWKERRADVKELEARFEGLRPMRDELAATAPESMPQFLDWFDQRFLARAKPIPRAEESA